MWQWLCLCFHALAVIENKLFSCSRLSKLTEEYSYKFQSWVNLYRPRRNGERFSPLRKRVFFLLYPYNDQVFHVLCLITKRNSKLCSTRAEKRYMSTFISKLPHLVREWLLHIWHAEWIVGHFRSEAVVFTRRSLPYHLVICQCLARFMPAKHVAAPCRYLSANDQRSYQAGVGIFYRIHVWKITPRNAIGVLWPRPRSFGDFPLIVVHLSRSNGIVDDISASCAILILRTFILFPENGTIPRKWAIWYYWSNYPHRYSYTQKYTFVTLIRPMGQFVKWSTLVLGTPLMSRDACSILVNVPLSVSVNHLSRFITSFAFRLSLG